MSLIPPASIITLTTDFGASDHYAGAMCGVMLSINPQLRFVDITHQINSYDLTDAAYTTDAAYRYFPAGTIHLIVVDPGVGSGRRAILACCGNYYFIAPDNGVLSAVFMQEEDVSVFEISETKYFLQQVSATFHGRDIFAPAAAWLSTGIEPASFGKQITDYKLIDLPQAQLKEPDIISGQIIKVDKFGNMISNITYQDIESAKKKWGKQKFIIELGEAKITNLIQYYAQAKDKQPCALFGSSGYLEIVIKQQRACDILGISVGQHIRLIYL